MWLSDDITPTTPSSRPSSSGSVIGQEGITSELSPVGSLAKPQPGRPQHTTPESEFATEVKIIKITISIVKQKQPLKHTLYFCSPPQGVLRIHLVEAQNLIAKDNFMGGMVKGKSDPYVKIRVTGITFRSHTIKENLNPIWNELYEVLYQTFFSYSAD